VIKEPKTREEKIQFLRERAPYVNRRLQIYSGYNPEMKRWEKYYLSQNGMISASDRSGMIRYRIPIEEFADKYDMKGLNIAVNKVKVVRIPSNP